MRAKKSRATICQGPRGWSFQMRKPYIMLCPGQCWMVLLRMSWPGSADELMHGESVRFQSVTPAAPLPARLISSSVISHLIPTGSLPWQWWYNVASYDYETPSKLLEFFFITRTACNEIFKLIIDNSLRGDRAVSRVLFLPQLTINGLIAERKKREK